MRSLADLDEPLVRTTRKLVEERLRSLAGSYLIPLGDDHQRRNLDPLRIVVWLSPVPVIAVVLGPARWGAPHWAALALNQPDRWPGRPPTMLRTSSPASNRSCDRRVRRPASAAARSPLVPRHKLLTEEAQLAAAVGASTTQPHTAR